MIAICDVTARDGLQSEAVILSPQERAHLIERLVAAGIRHVETSSFVNAGRVPQMSGAEEVVKSICRRRDVVYAGLCLNIRGYERLASSSLDEVRFAFAVTDTFNRRNAGTDVEGALDQARCIFEAARRDGIATTVVIGAAFGCPFEGAVDERRVVAVADRMREHGAGTVLLADTIGVAGPAQVYRLVRMAAGQGPVGVHLHDTRGAAIANAFAALDAGATILDASTGGIGGCPFAPNGAGNVCTEDLVYSLERSGVDTGIDLDALIDAVHWLRGVLKHPLSGRMHLAGLPRAWSTYSPGDPKAQG